MSIIQKTFVTDKCQLKCWICVLYQANDTYEFWFRSNNILKFLNVELPQNDNSTYKVKTLKDLGARAPNWDPNYLFISERGLYLLIIRSTQKESVDFLRWIHQLLPSIGNRQRFKRKTLKKYRNVFYDPETKTQTKYTLRVYSLNKHTAHCDN